MKNILKVFSILIIFVVLKQNALAQLDSSNFSSKRYNFIKNKSVNKLYVVSSSHKLIIKNIFGNVNVHTWAKNEIKVDITIEVTGNTEKIAQKIIDIFKVKEYKDGSDISLTTYNEGTYNTMGQKSSVKVNYEISMPSSNPLKITNEFGSTVLPDYKGEVDLTNKFCSFTTGNLSNVKSINIESVTAKIESITNGSVKIRSSLVDIGKLSGAVKLDVGISNNATKINVDNSLLRLDASVSYATLILKPVGDLSASYNISTSFGSFRNRTNTKFDWNDNNDFSGNREMDLNLIYTGKSGSGDIPVKVQCNSGNIVLGEPTQSDIKKLKLRTP